MPGTVPARSTAWASPSASVTVSGVTKDGPASPSTSKVTAMSSTATSGACGQRASDASTVLVPPTAAWTGVATRSMCATQASRNRSSPGRSVTRCGTPASVRSPTTAEVRTSTSPPVAPTGTVKMPSTAPAELAGSVRWVRTVPLRSRTDTSTLVAPAAAKALALRSTSPDASSRSRSAAVHCSVFAGSRSKRACRTSRSLIDCWAARSATGSPVVVTGTGARKARSRTPSPLRSKRERRCSD